MFSLGLVRAASKDKRKGEEFVSIGGYAPPEAERLLEALTAAQIKFQIGCDDGIHGSLSKFGTFGGYAKIRVFIDRKQIPKATHIQKTLFGE